MRPGEQATPRTSARLDEPARDTSDDKTTRDRRVPEGHSAVYCSSPPGREDSKVFLAVYCSSPPEREDSNVFTLTFAISHCASHSFDFYTAAFFTPTIAIARCASHLAFGISVGLRSKSWKTTITDDRDCTLCSFHSHFRPLGRRPSLTIALAHCAAYGADHFTTLCLGDSSRCALHTCSLLSHFRLLECQITSFVLHGYIRRGRLARWPTLGVD